jgi:hypothetical protein
LGFLADVLKDQTNIFTDVLNDRTGVFSGRDSKRRAVSIYRLDLDFSAVQQSRRSNLIVVTLRRPCEGLI